MGWWARLQRSAVVGSTLLAVGALVAVANAVADRPPAAGEDVAVQRFLVDDGSLVPPPDVHLGVVDDNSVGLRTEHVAPGRVPDPPRATASGSVDHGPDHASSSVGTDQRPVVFASDRSGDWEIYTIDVERGLLRRLTSHEGVDRQPT